MKVHWLPRISSFLKSHPLCIFIVLGVVQYAKLLKGKTIGWDTTDANYTNFLFLVDSFKSGYFPYYNPFTLGGFSTAQNFFTTNLFNPIDFSLGFLSLIFSPLYIFQLQYPVFGLLSGYWIYSHLRQINRDELLSLLGGVSYFMALMFPVLGQSPFFFSFVFFAFLLGPFQKLIVLNGKVSFSLSIVWAIALCLKSYFFFIPFLMGGAFLLLIDKNVPTKKMLVALGVASLGYVVLTYPVLSHVKALLSDLHGNFISPEPRLRSLIPQDVMFHKSFLYALGDLVDRKFMPGSAWSHGFNLCLLYLFIARFTIFLKEGHKERKDKILLVSMVFFIFMTTGTLSLIHKNLPIIASSRWGFSYIHFSQICYLFFICSKLPRYDLLGRKEMTVISVIFFIILVILGFKNPGMKSIIILGAYFFLSMLFIYKRKLIIPAALLVTIIYGYRAGRDMALPGGNTTVEMEKTAEREILVTVTQNKREIGEPGDYKFNDRTCIHRKVATLNGYNNSIHPIFWYLKARPEAGNLVVPICDEKIFNLGDRATYPLSDNLYLEKFTHDIVTAIQEYGCEREIERFFASPESFKLTSTSRYTLILQNLNFFNTPEAVKREKKLPGGMRVIETDPDQEVTFEYKKFSVLFQLAYLLVSFVIIGIYGLALVRPGRMFLKQSEL